MVERLEKKGGDLFISFSQIVLSFIFFFVLRIILFPVSRQSGASVLFDEADRPDEEANAGKMNCGPDGCYLSF